MIELLIVLKKGTLYAQLIISLQGLAIYLFSLRSMQYFEGLKMFSEDYGAPQGVLVCIGGALMACLLTMFMPIKQWVHHSLGYWFYLLLHRSLVGMITLTKIRYPDRHPYFHTMVFVLVILLFSTTSHIIKNGSSTAISFIID